MGSEMTWNEAILTVLRENVGEEMSLGDITGAILDARYRTSLGKTPQSTVGSQLLQVMRDHDVIRTRRGYYLMPLPNGAEGDELESGLDAVPALAVMQIEAYGIHWERSKVNWTARRILGYDTDPLEAIDFSSQQGVYVLYDWNSVVYVGKTTSTSEGLLDRLQYHNRKQDWEAGWERFSWFGIRKVNEDGEISDGPDMARKDVVSELIEAVLIETLRPAFNKQYGRHMGTLYRQAVDPYFATR